LTFSSFTAFNRASSPVCKRFSDCFTAALLLLYCCFTTRFSAVLSFSLPLHTFVSKTKCARIRKQAFELHTLVTYPPKNRRGFTTNTFTRLFRHSIMRCGPFSFNFSPLNSARAQYDRMSKVSKVRKNSQKTVFFFKESG
jgi:hypothetical protein